MIQAMGNHVNNLKNADSTFNTANNSSVLITKIDQLKQATKLKSVLSSNNSFATKSYQNNPMNRANMSTALTSGMSGGNSGAGGVGLRRNVTRMPSQNSFNTKIKVASLFAKKGNS